MICVNFQEFSRSQTVISQQAARMMEQCHWFYNLEFHVDTLSSKRVENKESKAELIERMQGKLKFYPGIDLNFSQPISDNVEEAVSGVKGSIVIKLFGDDLKFVEKKEEQIFKIMKDIKGVEDLGIMRNLGQPELQIDLDQEKMAFYGVTTADAGAVIETAIGGKAATQIYEGERKFDLRIRYPESFRNNANAIGDLRVPTLSGSKVPLREIANIKKLVGPSLIYRDKHKRYGAIKFSVRGRDMGSTIRRLRKK